jgi:hypothetical protein
MCTHCVINEYLLTDVSAGKDITIQDGVITTTMGASDIITTFNIIPVFSDVDCKPLFEPSSLRVNLKLEHKCGNDDDSINVSDASPHFILELTENKDYSIESA